MQRTIVGGFLNILEVKKWLLILKIKNSHVCHLKTEAALAAVSSLQMSDKTIPKRVAFWFYSRILISAYWLHVVSESLVVSMLLL